MVSLFHYLPVTGNIEPATSWSSPPAAATSVSAADLFSTWMRLRRRRRHSLAGNDDGDGLVLGTLHH